MVFKKESLLKRLEKLREYLNDISEIANLSLERYISDKKTKYMGERILFLICENILDFLDHVLASRFNAISDNYEDIITNAFSRALISDKLYNLLKGLGGLRNVLAHEYLNLSDEKVYANITRIRLIEKDILREFEHIIKTQI